MQTQPSFCQRTGKTHALNKGGNASHRLGWFSDEKGSEELPLTSSVPLHFTKTRSKVGQGQISEMCQLQHGLMREVPLHLSAPALEIIKGPKWELDIFDSEIL